MFATQLHRWEWLKLVKNVLAVVKPVRKQWSLARRNASPQRGASKWPVPTSHGASACYEKGNEGGGWEPTCPRSPCCTYPLHLDLGIWRTKAGWTNLQAPINRRYHIPLVCPFLQDVEPARWVPTKLSVHQQVHCARVVPPVLQHQLLPRWTKLIRPAMSKVLLPVIRREGGTVENVVQNVASKKYPTGPTERTPKPEYLIALATYLGVRW